MSTTCEPTLQEVLSEPIVEALMQADAVDAGELKVMLSAIAAELRQVRREPDAAVRL